MSLFILNQRKIIRDDKIIQRDNLSQIINYNPKVSSLEQSIVHQNYNIHSLNFILSESQVKTMIKDGIKKYDGTFSIYYNFDDKTLIYMLIDKNKHNSLEIDIRCATIGPLPPSRYTYHEYNIDYNVLNVNYKKPYGLNNLNNLYFLSGGYWQKTSDSSNLFFGYYVKSLSTQEYELNNLNPTYYISYEVNRTSKDDIYQTDDFEKMAKLYNLKRVCQQVIKEKVINIGLVNTTKNEDFPVIDTFIDKN